MRVLGDDHAVADRRARRRKRAGDAGVDDEPVAPLTQAPRVHAQAASTGPTPRHERLDAVDRRPERESPSRPRRRAESRSATPMNLWVCRERRKRCGCALRVVERERDVGGLVALGLQQDRSACAAKSARCSSGTRSASTISLASFGARAMRGSTRSFGETQSQTSSGRSVKDRAVRFDVHAAAVGAQRFDERGRFALARAVRRR